MSYTKHTWQPNELATAAKLNNMENGIEAANALPLVITIPAASWSSGSAPYTYTVQNAEVTANTILDIAIDSACQDNFSSTISVTPAAGSFTFSTDTLPTGSVTIGVFPKGLVGTAQYQVVADTYSTGQIDAKLGNEDISDVGTNVTNAINSLYSDKISLEEELENSFQVSDLLVENIDYTMVKDSRWTITTFRLRQVGKNVFHLVMIGTVNEQLEVGYGLSAAVTFSNIKEYTDFVGIATSNVNATSYYKCIFSGVMSDNKISIMNTLPDSLPANKTIRIYAILYGY